MKKETIKDLLHRFMIFKDLTDFEMEPIVDLAKNRPFRKGSHIFMQDDPLTNVYFIYEGKIKIYKTDFHGKEQIVNILQPGDMFPHQGFFRKDNYPAHAEVAENAVLIYIPIAQFEDFLITHPEICVKLFRVLGDLIVDLQSRLEEKILDNTYEQIIKLLLRLCKSHGVEKKDGIYQLTTQFTNRELASMIGSSRETVSRTLTQLKKKNMVLSTGQDKIVIDFHKLHEEII
ncbi:Crp/Fnr family transcriptional regulator [Virgibacillus halophilus]|uniref:Crp/Fnr family transcriptional regulator n=1 Tax=Tigheibacillus halophilus TaxID=361280 RepID=A0ABU5C9R9_9BACI|nr:Crp/Fnr family transcriptional regulator [Virgibacillus halophilus]